MNLTLLSAGLYHIAFGIWAMAWPDQWFSWLGLVIPNQHLPWQGIGLITTFLGGGMILTSVNPVPHWPIILAGFLKFTLGTIGLGTALIHGDIAQRALWILIADDLIWWFPFAAILWACIQAYAGIPPTRSEPLSLAEAGMEYTLSNGKTLAEASNDKPLALVFLRHFGCTFTRQILRNLETIQREANQYGADLVLVHMLQSGKESHYLGQRSGVIRIADPRCELYRAFGLGKGGFIELFGLHVWWRGAIAIFKGCGVGHLAGDGLQMPGAFLFHRGEIIASQRAQSAADLPDLTGLFHDLPAIAEVGQKVAKCDLPAI